MEIYRIKIKMYMIEMEKMKYSNVWHAIIHVLAIKICGEVKCGLLNSISKKYGAVGFIAFKD